MANILIKLERHKEAIEAYDEILKLDKDNAEAKQHKEVAIKELKKQEFSSLINEIKSKFQTKDYSKVIELCDQARKIDVDTPLPDIYKGNSLYELKRYEEAIQSYDKALYKNPQNPDALNKRKIAQEQIDAKLAKENKDKQLTNELTQGNNFFNQGKYQQALESFDKVLDIDPINGTAQAKKKLVLEYLSKEKPSSYSDTKSQGTMPKGWKPSSSSSSSDTISYYSEDFNSLNEKGIALYNQGKYQQAIEWFDKALRVNPNDANVLNNKGNSFNNLLKHQEAIEWFDKALIVDPNNVHALNNKGFALNQQGNLKRE